MSDFQVNVLLKLYNPDFHIERLKAGFMDSPQEKIESWLWKVNAERAIIAAPNEVKATFPHSDPSSQILP